MDFRGPVPKALSAQLAAIQTRALLNRASGLVSEIVRQDAGALPTDGDPEGAKFQARFDSRIDSRLYANRAKLH